MNDTSRQPLPIHPLFLVMSVVMHIVVVEAVILYSRFHPNTPPPPITEIIEVTMFELQAPAPAAQSIDPAPLVVEPDTPVEPPPKVEKPKPKPVEPPKEKPKTREELIRERFENSPISKDDPKKRQEEQRKAEQARRERDEALKRLQKTLDNAATGFKPSAIAPTTGSKVIGVSADQMSQYQRYMVNCVTPKVNALWQKLGPSGLDTLPTPAVIRFVVNPAGRVLSYMFTTRSNSAAVNDAGEALGKALMQEGLPPFRQVGLTTEGNAALTIDFTLKYER